MKRLLQSVPTRVLAATLIGLAGVTTGCTNATDTDRPANASQTEPAQAGLNPTAESPAQATTSAVIPDGYYVLGGTDQGLEVSGNQYRYYDEVGRDDWHPLSDLTLIQDNVIFDGKNYWCIPPEGEAGVCTKNGWRSVQESLAEQARSQAFSQQELMLGGLSIGDEDKTVIRELGQPSQPSSNDYSTLEYPGFTVLLNEGIVIEMTSTSDQYCTPAGVCPGMTFAQVRELYGEPVVSDREDGQFMEYYSPDSSCWLKIVLNGPTDNEIVETVSVVCQP